MARINQFRSNLLDFIECYPKKIPKNIKGISGSEAGWQDPVWYIKDPDLGTEHRYLFIKSFQGKKRAIHDVGYNNKGDFRSQLILEPYCSLLKIYAIHVQSENIVTSSRQLRVVKAARVLTEAENYECLNDVPADYWNSVKGSNLFWDFCKKNKLISGERRPIHEDRTRSADAVFERSDDRLKMTPESTIIAMGEIFSQVFKDVGEEGELIEGGSIDVQDAVSITAALLGLAAPNRTNAEVPLLANQELKTVKGHNGKPVNYLDWPGSKGFSDNKNHILSALAPQVKKAIGFFHKYLKPERYYVRYLKNTSQTWESILAGFEVNPERIRKLDFSKKPNLFTVAYALGFYPIEYKVAVLKSPDCIIDNEGFRGWEWARKWIPELKRYTRIADCIKEKNISEVVSDDLFVNMSGSYYNKRSPAYSIHRLISAPGVTRAFKSRLALPLVFDVESIENAIIRIHKKDLPTFPVAYTHVDKGIDLEYALFCISLKKHGFSQAKQTSGSPLFISSLKKVSTNMFNSLSSKKSEAVSKGNIFVKYGFAPQRFNIHSLRHFANTQAEKGGIPLALISVWSGRRNVKQTLEYVHTTEQEKSERVISTLELDNDQRDIRVISADNLKTEGGLPASATNTGICVQELAVTPCNYLNDFLNGCFGCESACYVCGDEKSIELLRQDLGFQKIRLDKIREIKDSFISDSQKAWWLKHSVGVAVLDQLIDILKTGQLGHLVRVSKDRGSFFITNIDTKRVEERTAQLPSKEEMLAQLQAPRKVETDVVPETMRSVLQSFGIKN